MIPRERIGGCVPVRPEGAHHRCCPDGFGLVVAHSTDGCVVDGPPQASPDFAGESPEQCQFLAGGVNRASDASLASLKRHEVASRRSARAEVPVTKLEPSDQPFVSAGLRLSPSPLP